MSDLYEAIFEDYTEIARQILAKPEPRRLLPIVEDWGNSSPWHSAASVGHDEIIKFFVDAGVQLDSKFQGETALHSAVNFGQESTVKLLLELGCDAKVKDSNGRTVLDLAKQLETEIGKFKFKDIVKVLEDNQKN